MGDRREQQSVPAEIPVPPVPEPIAERREDVGRTRSTTPALGPPPHLLTCLFAIAGGLCAAIGARVEWAALVVRGQGQPSPVAGTDVLEGKIAFGLGIMACIAGAAGLLRRLPPSRALSRSAMAIAAVGAGAIGALVASASNRGPRWALAMIYSAIGAGIVACAFWGFVGLEGQVIDATTPVVAGRYSVSLDRARAGLQQAFAAGALKLSFSTGIVLLLTGGILVAGAAATVAAQRDPRPTTT